MVLAMRTPTQTPMDAGDGSTTEVAMLRRSSRPSQTYGTHLHRLITKKKYASVAVNFSGLGRSAIT